jgi:hypothetical protein
MGCYAITRTGDQEYDARHNERLAWNRVVESMERLCARPHDRADLERRQYERSKASYARAWQQLCEVTP